MSEEVLQIAEKGREGNGEKERYTHQIQSSKKLARRDKKTFLSDQCKKIEKNYRMGKTRDFFTKIIDTRGTFHANICTIKDRNSMDQTEAEDIKKRCQKYTEVLCKNDFNDHNGVITHLEPEILDCEDKWALGSLTTKLVDVMDFQLSYFKS